MSERPALDKHTSTEIEDGSTATNGGSKQQEQDTGIVINAQDITADMAQPRKTKKKSKGARLYQRGQGKPTGFEDNFADAPMTVDQHNEMKELFHTVCEQPRLCTNIDECSRILRAIQRFEKTRKLSSERRDIFRKYLAYSGIDIDLNIFQGQQQTEMSGKDEITANNAQTHMLESMKAIIYDPKAAKNSVYDATTSGQETLQLNEALLHDLRLSDDQLRGTKYKYIIDFQNTMCAFISRRAPNLADLSTIPGIDLVTTTMERFLDYLLQHDVCPEYASEVLQTRNLCRAAKNELWACARVQKHLPGDFNIACSTLFGGSYGRDYDGESYWGPAQPGENVFVGLTVEKASQIVGFGMAALAEDDIYMKYIKIVEEDKVFSVAKTVYGHGFEITATERATGETCRMYRTNVEDIRPIGKISAKFWINPETPPDDLTDEERANDSSVLGLPRDREFSNSVFQDQMVFFLEDSTILPFLAVGQKIECTIHQLECGIWFFDEVIRIYPKFDIWIENELVFGWTEPKPVNLGLELSQSVELVGDGETVSFSQHGDAAEAAEKEIDSQQYGSDDEPY